MLRLAFHTLGCKVNAYETEAIVELFKKKNYNIVSFDDIADVYIINTCTVTNIAAKKSRQMIRRAISLNKHAKIVVMGCYAQDSKEEIKKIDGVDIIVGTNNRTEILSYIENIGIDTVDKVGDISIVREYEELSINEFEGKNRAYIKIQDGCNNFCSYCIIPYTRGRVRSRKIDDIYKEVYNLAQNGYKEIVLTGINVASYGKDLGIELLDLIYSIHDIKGLERIRFSSIEPNLITNEFVNKLKEYKKICPHFHLSMQSGCDEILESMNRRYNTHKYREAVLILKNSFPDVSITTDIIVGFPGENEYKFNKTYEFVKSIGFYQIHVFPYSIRENTKAACMKEQIPKNIKHTRVNKMIDLGNTMEREYINLNLNKKFTVLFESYSDGYYEGYTPNYIRVRVRSSYDIINKILDVYLEENKENYVLGKIMFA